jgi:hypothetical protein
MIVELLKVLVQPVVLERDDAGRIVGERLGETTPLYTLDHVAEFVAAVEGELARANNGAAATVAPLPREAPMSETTETPSTEPQGDPVTEPETPTTPAEPDTPDTDADADDGDGEEGGDDE